MQANTADANGTVDSGIWQASFNRSADKRRSVSARVSTPKRRLARLEARMERLETKRDTLPEAVYLARASRLSAEIDAIERTINETESVASTVDVNATRLDRLRSATRNTSGHETVEVARTVTVVDTRARPGPPDRAGRQNESGPPDIPSPSVDEKGSEGPDGDGEAVSIAVRSPGPLRVDGNGLSVASAGAGPPDDVENSGSNGLGNGNDRGSGIPSNSSGKVPGDAATPASR